MTDYFVDPIWPKRRLNIIAGASGAGKSRWILPQLFALIKGTSVLGKPTTPTKVSYVCCDRTIEDAQSTMIDLGLNPEILPTFSFMDNNLQWSMGKVLEMIPQDTELCFVEAIGALVPGGDINNYSSILKLGRICNLTTKTSGISFMGSTHAPKMKAGEAYARTRDNVIGSSAWPGIAATIVHISEEEDNSRTVTILLRDGPTEVQHLEFDAIGKLVPIDAGLGRILMDNWLKGLPSGTDLPTSLIQDQGVKSKLSPRTVSRWINEKVSDGCLLSVKQGWYKSRSSS